MTLKIQWFPSNVRKDKEEKTKYEQTIRNNKFALERLREIIEEKTEELSAPSKLDDYEKDSWPYLQADRAGQARAYRSILTLLEFTK